MATNITSPQVGAIVVQVAEDRSRPLNPGEPIKFNTTMDGQDIVGRSHVPMYDSCRELMRLGHSGLVQFVRTDGTLTMSMDIEVGALLTVEEGPTGPAVRKYRGNDAGEPMADGQSAPAPVLDTVEA